MKKLIFFGCVMLLNVAVKAQSPTDLQKEMEKAKSKLNDPSIQAKMKRAQMLSDSMARNAKVQGNLQKGNDILNQQKAKHPDELKDVQMPDSINGKVPSVDAITTEMNNAASSLQNYSRQIDQSMPKRDISKNADKILRLSKKSLVEMAQFESNKVKPNLSFNEKDTVNLLMKDTGNNLAGIGVFVLSSGGSKNAAAYLICQGVIRRPNNRWSANDMGVLFRSMQLYEQALQCFFYASSVDSGKSVVINTNIAWASAYYGDFATAHKYFDKALSVDENFSSALEGQAILAYQEGNVAALFQCLAKEIKYMGGAGGGHSMNEPSDAFTSTCSNAAARNSQSNTDDNVSDNSDNEPDQDAPPTADVEPVNYPSYRPVFVGSAKDLITASVTANKMIRQYYDKQKTYEAKLVQTLSSLKPLDQRPYKDDEGDVIYPNKFKKWVELIAQERAKFQQVTTPIDSAYVKEMNNYLKTLPPHDQDLLMQYTKELGKCVNAKDKKKCEDGVNCTWIPKMLNSKNSDIESANKIWNTYSHKIRRKIQAYLSATAPFIARVHAEGWNEYLNMQREVDVRMAILKTYNLWCSVVIGLSASPLLGAIQQTVPSCPPIDINGMDPPDAINQKPKHIKEFEGPCPKMSFDMGIGGIDEDCHTTKFSIGRGPFKAFYEHVDDPLYAQDHNYTGKAGLNVGLDTWIGVDDEESGIKAGVNAKLEGTAWLKFDANGTITGAGSEVAASGALGFKGEASGLEAGASIGTGVTVSTEWQVVAGQMQVVGHPAAVKVGGGE